jgi:hypothetical protein
MRRFLLFTLMAAGASAFAPQISLFSKSAAQRTCHKTVGNGVLGMNAALKALLFDCDGVLADTVRVLHLSAHVNA